jgi:tetratricopeptide (TPR) repeat protein
MVLQFHHKNNTDTPTKMLSNENTNVGNVLALTANAVNFLSGNGNIQGAIDVLHEALAALRQCVTSKSMDTAVSDDGQHSSFRSVSTNVDAFPNCQDGNPFCLLNRAILFEGCHPTSTPSDELLNHLSMVITYNLGLAYHLLGMQNGNNQRKNYNKALKMYKVTASLMRLYPDNRGRDLLYLAVFNNMGNIYSHFYDRENTQHCLEGMKAILMSCSDNDELKSEDYSPFYMNMMMFYRQRTVASAAA